jgi:hypothetical protein
MTGDPDAAEVIEAARRRGLSLDLCEGEIARLETLGARCGLAFIEALEALETLFIFDGWRDEARPADLAVEAVNLAAESFRSEHQAVVFLKAARRALGSRPAP